MYAQYLPDPALIADWRVSPILAENHAGLPAAFVLSAACEIMRDDIEDYARILLDSGVPTECRRYAGMIHPFLSLAGAIPEGVEAIDDCARALRSALVPGKS